MPGGGCTKSGVGGETTFVITAVLDLTAGSGTGLGDGPHVIGCSHSSDSGSIHSNFNLISHILLPWEVFLFLDLQLHPPPALLTVPFHPHMGEGISSWIPIGVGGNTIRDAWVFPPIIPSSTCFVGKIFQAVSPP